MVGKGEEVRKLFTYEEAMALLPEVQRLTSAAAAEVEQSPETAEAVVEGWAEAVMALGIEVKGLWLIDFDNGSGYYCWRYPEPALEYFHGYEEGFRGRVKLN
jgi:hypothetical protein